MIRTQCILLMTLIEAQISQSSSSNDDDPARGLAIQSAPLGDRRDLF